MQRLLDKPAYQCSEEEITFQFENYDLVDSHICDSEYAWLQAQNAIRDASVFIDVGGNVGYTSARMFGMWSPGHGYNRLVDEQIEDIPIHPSIHPYL